MENLSNFNDILLEDRDLGPFPMHRLRRVERPTTLITNNVKRIDWGRMDLMDTKVR